MPNVAIAGVASLTSNIWTLEKTTQPKMFAQTNDAKKERTFDRCSVCRKKLGITGFECRCADVFCTNHRYPWQHNCSVDVRKMQSDVVKKNNILVSPMKVEKI